MNFRRTVHISVEAEKNCVIFKLQWKSHSSWYLQETNYMTRPISRVCNKRSSRVFWKYVYNYIPNSFFYHIYLEVHIIIYLNIMIYKYNILSRLWQLYSLITHTADYEVYIPRYFISNEFLRYFSIEDTILNSIKQCHFWNYFSSVLVLQTRNLGPEPAHPQPSKSGLAYTTW